MGGQIVGTDQAAFMELSLVGTALIILIVLALLAYVYKLMQDKKKIIEPLNKKLDAFSKVFDTSKDAVFMLTGTDKIVYANKSVIKLFDLSDNYMSKKTEIDLKVKIKKDWTNWDQFLLNTDNDEEGTKSFTKSSLLSSDKRIGEIPVNIHIDTFFIEDEKHKIISFENIKKEKDNETLSFLHKLTKLPNQDRALVDLNILYSKTHLQNGKIALVLLNIDNFSRLRSVIGYEQADNVFVKVAQYLTSLGNANSFMPYHTHHNNFLLIVTNVNSIEGVTTLVKSIQKELTSFYKMGNTDLYLTASAGISIYPDSGPTLKLLDNAYKALSYAEKNGYGQAHVYMPDDESHEFDELMLLNQMNPALENEEFEIYYQPIIDTKLEKIVAAEALLRWNHPQHGIIHPDIFIPLMEKTGFVTKIGQYTLRKVLKQQKQWEQFNFGKVEISINTTLLEIEAEGFAENVANQLKEFGVSPKLLKYEIVEGSATANEKLARKQFVALKNLGVQVALDNFGVENTSFSYLKKFPADTLKINKVLMGNILKSEEDQRIVKAIIDLAHGLGLNIVAEGIDTKQKYELAVSYGCDFAQGFYFAKPLPVFEFQTLLVSNDK